MKKENIIFGLIGIALSGYVFLETSKFPSDNIMNVGPAFFPRVLAVGLGIFCLILIFVNIFSGDQDQEKRFDIKDSGVHRAAIALLATIIYGIIMPYLGFIITTILYLSFMMYLMKLRSWKKIPAVSIGVSFVVYTIFRTFLHITLPVGFWA